MTSIAWDQFRGSPRLSDRSVSKLAQTFRQINLEARPEFLDESNIQLRLSESKRSHLVAAMTVHAPKQYDFFARFSTLRTKWTLWTEFLPNARNKRLQVLWVMIKGDFSRQISDLTCSSARNKGPEVLPSSALKARRPSNNCWKPSFLSDSSLRTSTEAIIETQKQSMNIDTPLDIVPASSL